MTANPPLERKLHRIRQFLMAGLVAGLAALVVNNLIYLILTIAGDVQWVVPVALSVTVASFLPNLLGAVIYFLLKQNTGRARLIFSVGVIVFVLISILPHLGIGPAPSEALDFLPDGFAVITIPLHLVFGLTTATIMPYLADRQ